MELPVNLAVDTRDNWNHSDVALGPSELAIETNNPGEAEYRYLLLGDGEVIGGNVSRLRATADFIAGLPEQTKKIAAAAIEGNMAGLQAADQSLRKAIDGEISERGNADSDLRAAIQEETAERQGTDNELRAAVEEETAERQGTDNELRAAVEGLDGAKISKAVAGQGTLVQKIKVKERNSNSFVVAHENVSVENGAVTETEVELPQASEEQSGIMPAESFLQLEENTRQIAVLEGRSRHYPVSLASDDPAQEDLQAAYEEVSGSEGAPPDMTTLDDIACGKSYTYYESQAAWVDIGNTTIGKMSNALHGLIRGENADGKVFAESDGTGSVVGWTALKTAVANIASAAENFLERLVLKADTNSPTFTGTPKVPTKTSAATSGGTLIATEAQVALKANIASPALTGTPTAPTPAATAKSTQIATAAYVLNALCPVGSRYIQYPNDLDPAERYPWTAASDWVDWTQRVETYGLSASLPASGSMPAYDAGATSAIAANSYRLVTHADGDTAVYQAMKQIPVSNEFLNAQGQPTIGPFNEAFWRELSDVSTASYRPIFVARRRLQAWTTSTDYAIRSSVTYNNVTYMVSARYTMGGKFMSFRGGNRPPFESASGQDATRKLSGGFSLMDFNIAANGGGANGNAEPSMSGVIKKEAWAYKNNIPNGLGYGNSWLKFSIDSSLSVPVGPENSVRTLSVRYWRRIS